MYLKGTHRQLCKYDEHHEYDVGLDETEGFCADAAAAAEAEDEDEDGDCQQDGDEQLGEWKIDSVFFLSI